MRFCSIGQSDSELGRMLEVLRFWFTKDLVRRPSCACDSVLIMNRNTSRESLASLTTLSWASSSEYVLAIWLPDAIA